MYNEKLIFELLLFEERIEESTGTNPSFQVIVPGMILGGEAMKTLLPALTVPRTKYRNDLQPDVGLRRRLTSKSYRLD